MIARISSGSSVGGAMAYNEDKVEEGEAEILDYKNFGVDSEDMSSSGAVAIMKVMCAQNPRVKNNVFSCSLNLNHEDLDNMDAKIQANGATDENDLYRKIADQYMKGMGYGNQPYVVYKHDDIERTHIHIVSIRVDEEGKKINSTFEHKRSERVRGEVNEQFGLSTEGENKGKKLSAYDRIRIADSRNDYISRAYERINKAAQPEALVNGTSHLKHQISNVLKFVDENYHPKNLNEFNKVLSQFNVVCKPCTKGEDAYGKGYTGCQYAVLNSNGEVDSHLIKGSAFGKQYAMPALMAKFELNKGSEDIRKSDEISKKYIRETIDSFIKAPAKTDFDSLAEHLNEKGIKVNMVADLDDPTKIKGINFIDNVNGNTYNGSQLGKAYSYQNICGAIDKHNAEVDRESAKTADNVYLPKEEFIRTQQILQAYFNSKFNDIREMDPYYTPSKLVKDWIDYSVSNKDKPLEHLFGGAKNMIENNSAKKENKNPLTLTDAQWHKAADYFFKDIVRKLPEMEFKEQAYQRSLLISAVKFSQHIPSEQDRVDFLQRAGVNVFYSNNDIQFNSYARKDVGLSLKELCEVTKEDAEPIRPSYNLFVADKGLPDPDYNLPALNKYERDFFKDYLKNETKPGFKLEASAVVNLLDKSEKQPMIDNWRVPSDMWKNNKNPFNDLQKDLVKENYNNSKLQFIDNFDKHENAFRNVALKACSNIPVIADKMVADYKSYLAKERPEVEQRENELAKDRIVTATLFASKNVFDRKAQSEFFARMGVKAECDMYGQLMFSTLSNPNFKMTNMDLGKAGRKYPVMFAFRLNASLPEHIQQINDKSLRKFSANEVKQVELSNDNKLDDSTYDYKCKSPFKYVSDGLKYDFRKLETTACLHNVIDRNPNASTDAVVKALLCRGFVIQPTDALGTKFKIGKIDKKDDKMVLVDMPNDLSDRLRRSNYMAIKKDLDDAIQNSALKNYKTYLLMNISKAADYGQPERLDKEIEKVNTYFPKLASAMQVAKGQDAEHPDYERVSNLVFSYKYEDNITMPPPTQRQDSFVNPPAEDDREASYREMLEFLRHGTYLEYMIKRATEIQKEKEEFAAELKKLNEVGKNVIFKGNSVAGSPDFDGLCKKFNIELSKADKNNLSKLGNLPHTVHSVIDGVDRELLLAYDKKNNQFALASPASFDLDPKRIRGGMPEETFKGLMKDGVAMFKDCPNVKDGSKKDTVFFLNPVSMSLHYWYEPPKFEGVQSVKLNISVTREKVEPLIQAPQPDEQDNTQRRGFKHGL